MKPTLEDVADVAGVSRATVSRVVNGSHRVSEEVRMAVEGAVARLGYVPNRAARSLVTHRTESIGLVVRETGNTVFSEPFFAGIVRAINRHVTENGFQMLLVMAEPSDRLSRLEHYLTGGHVDGVLLVSMHGDDGLLRLLLEAGIPTVIGGRSLAVDRVSSVDADNRGGASAAVQHLASTGRSKIGTVAGPRDMGVGLDRFDGFADGLRAGGTEVDDSLVVEGDFSQESGQRAAEILLDRHPDMDAVFAASDLMAAGALQALVRAGRRVPEDVAVVGFDDSSVALLTDPPLSTVKQPLEAMGHRMSELLLAQITSGDQSVRREVLPTQLVVRRSSSLLGDEEQRFERVAP